MRVIYTGTADIEFTAMDCIECMQIIIDGTGTQGWFGDLESIALTPMTMDIDWAPILAIDPSKSAGAHAWWVNYSAHGAAARHARTAAPIASRPTRPQARRCHLDARRWKRRRFVQALQAEAC